MNISIIDNTLQNYITKYIEQTFATHVLGNRYDKLYRNAEFNNEHHINKSDLKTLEKGKDLANKINNINLLQQNEKNEEFNIRKTFAHSIKTPSIEKYKLEHLI